MLWCWQPPVTPSWWDGPSLTRRRQVRPHLISLCWHEVGDLPASKPDVDLAGLGPARDQAGMNKHTMYTHLGVSLAVHVTLGQTPPQGDTSPFGLWVQAGFGHLSSFGGLSSLHSWALFSRC